MRRRRVLAGWKVATRNTKLTVQFLRNDYLKLKASRELVFMNTSQPPPLSRESFEFVGICLDNEKERESWMKEKREAAPSAASRVLV